MARVLAEQPNPETSRQFFILGCVVEGGLFLLGAGLSWLFGQGLLSNMHWAWRDSLVGLAAAVPPLSVFWWTLRSKWRFCRDIRHFLDDSILPIIRPWQVSQFFLICALAGLGEEFFFRAAVQGGLTQLVGPTAALILAGLIFGACHSMTWGYIALTSLMGVYLGALWSWTGNLLGPVITHAVYDFAAMLYLLRLRKKPD